MSNRLRWIFDRLSRKLWFRAGLYGLIAVITALIAALTSPLFPEEFSSFVGADAIEDILKILASSMLAVATFSLGTMVAAQSTATSNATPRASQLLVEDPTSQNALSTFIGAFIFSLIGIIALNTGYYGPGGRLVLFVVTIFIVIVIVVTFFTWIDYLTHLGRISEVTDKVETAAATAMRARCKAPLLAGREFKRPPETATPLPVRQIGYIQYVDVGALSSVAEAANGEVYVVGIPGKFADSREPLAWTSWQPDEEEREALRQGFVTSNVRSFDQDPRFGMIVLSEIASRALSSGVNDPGTAIDTIGRIVRVLAILAEPNGEASDEVEFENVFIPAVRTADLFDDAFSPIARDGADLFEVGVRLQKAFASLARLGDDELRVNAERHSKIAFERSKAALEREDEIAALADLAKLVLSEEDPANPVPAERSV